LSSTANPISENDSAREVSLQRLIGISDGVFAVAMTFLAFTVRLPAAGPDGSRPPAAEALRQVLPQLYTLAIAFFAASRFWVIHHRIFSSLKRADGVIVGLNLLELLTLVLLPISGDLVGVYPREPLIVAIFAANLALIGIGNAGIWYAAATRGLMIDAITPERIRAGHWRGGFSVSMYLASIPVCWISTQAAKAMWLLTIFLIFIKQRVEARRTAGVSG